MGILKKFLSRKFLATVAAVVILVTGILRGDAAEAAMGERLTQWTEYILAATPIVYIVIEGIADIVSRKNKA